MEAHGCSVNTIEGLAQHRVCDVRVREAEAGPHGSRVGQHRTGFFLFWLPAVN